MTEKNKLIVYVTDWIILGRLYSPMLLIAFKDLSESLTM